MSDDSESIEKKSPFVVGAIVAVRSGGYYRDDWRKGVIAKVHKNGNFVLDDGPQQYRPWGNFKGASATGTSRYKNTIEPCGPEIEEELKEAQELRRHEARCRAIMDMFSIRGGRVIADPEITKTIYDLIRQAIIEEIGK